MSKAKPKTPVVVIDIRFVEMDRYGPGKHLATDGLRLDFSNADDAHELYEAMEAVLRIKGIRAIQWFVSPQRDFSHEPLGEAIHDAKELITGLEDDSDEN